MAGHILAILLCAHHRLWVDGRLLSSVVMVDVALRLPSPLVEIHDERAESWGVRLYLKRDDLIHAELPGNKWRKLKYNIADAREQGVNTLLTFGGAYSNHLRATAAAGHYFDFNTVGVVRGEEHVPLNDTLARAVSHGMKLVYMDRGTYREKASPRVIAELRARFGDFYLIPEGGSNALAVKGCRELAHEIEVDFDVICCPCGTGGTLAGISGALHEGQRAVGFSAFRGGRFLVDTVAELQRQSFGAIVDNWTIETEFHFGGFARRTSELDDFVKLFKQRHELTLDWVYVAKMMFGITALVRRGAFTPGTRIVAVITG
jgi:1-aminocyclopropane-1-carboxylate deaminase